MTGPDNLQRLTDQFLEAYRAGGNPSIDEFAARHPELADQSRNCSPPL